MTILCIALVLALISVTAISFWRERTHRVVIADLLDRIMARSYGEYDASRPHPSRPALRRRAMTDEEMAVLEKSKKSERAG